jgi:3alpha(or 20beta)-hydroxysteroid dehydrogenase
MLITANAALEFADWGIRVNTIHPGLVLTPLISMGTPAYEAMASMTPMGRAAGAKELVASSARSASPGAARVQFAATSAAGLN